MRTTCASGLNQQYNSGSHSRLSTCARLASSEAAGCAGVPCILRRAEREKPDAYALGEANMAGIVSFLSSTLLSLALIDTVVSFMAARRSSVQAALEGVPARYFSGQRMFICFGLSSSSEQETHQLISNTLEASIRWDSACG